MSSYKVCKQQLSGNYMIPAILLHAEIWEHLAHKNIYSLINWHKILGSINWISQLASIITVNKSLKLWFPLTCPQWAVWVWAEVTARSLEDSVRVQGEGTQSSAPGWRVSTERRLRMTWRLTMTRRGHCSAEAPLTRTLARRSRAC